MKCFFYLVFFLFLFSCRNNEKSQIYLDNEKRLMDFEQSVIDKIDSLTKNNLNSQVNNQRVYFGLDSLNTFNIKQLTGHHKFFLYFSVEACPPCIQETIERIKEAFPDYKKDDEIIFISPDYPKRFRINCHGKKLLTLENRLGIGLEQENAPFLFTLNSDLRMEKIHIVNKNDFQKLTDFLEELKSDIRE